MHTPRHRTPSKDMNIPKKRIDTRKGGPLSASAVKRRCLKLNIDANKNTEATNQVGMVKRTGYVGALASIECDNIQMEEEEVHDGAQPEIPITNNDEEDEVCGSLPRFSDTDVEMSRKEKQKMHFAVSGKPPVAVSEKILDDAKMKTDTNGDGVHADTACGAAVITTIDTEQTCQAIAVNTDADTRDTIVVDKDMDTCDVIAVDIEQTGDDDIAVNTENIDECDVHLLSAQPTISDQDFKEYVSTI